MVPLPPDEGASAPSTATVHLRYRAALVAGVAAAAGPCDRSQGKRPWEEEAAWPGMGRLFVLHCTQPEGGLHAFPPERPSPPELPAGRRGVKRRWCNAHLQSGLSAPAFLHRGWMDTVFFTGKSIQSAAPGNTGPLCATTTPHSSGHRFVKLLCPGWARVSPGGGKPALIRRTESL